MMRLFIGNAFLRVGICYEVVYNLPVDLPGFVWLVDVAA